MSRHFPCSHEWAGDRTASGQYLRGRERAGFAAFAFGVALVILAYANGRLLLKGDGVDLWLAGGLVLSGALFALAVRLLLARPS